MRPGGLRYLQLVHLKANESCRLHSPSLSIYPASDCIVAFRFFPFSFLLLAPLLAQITLSNLPLLRVRERRFALLSLSKVFIRSDCCNCQIWPIHFQPGRRWDAHPAGVDTLPAHLHLPKSCPVKAMVNAACRLLSLYTVNHRSRRSRALFFSRTGSLALRSTALYSQPNHLPRQQSTL